MKFIHITDLHLVPRRQKLWGLRPIARFEACLADIAAHHADAAFAVISGDLAENGDAASYRLLKSVIADFPMPVHLMLGNHDHRGNFLEAFGGADEGGYVQRMIEHEDTVFLLLDTLKGSAASEGLYDPARRAWLTRRLEERAGRPVHIFMHHPPFPIRHALMDRIGLEDGAGFMELLDGHEVRHIFFGHAHRPISGQRCGISFSCLPGINHQLPLVEASVPTVYSDEPPMYAVCDLSDGQITVHFDAFLNRKPARMPLDAAREGWG